VDLFDSSFIVIESNYSLFHQTLLLLLKLI